MASAEKYLSNDYEKIDDTRMINDAPIRNSTKKTELENNSEEKNNLNEKKSSNNEYQREVSEFNEIKEDVDDPQALATADYESKRVIKSIKKSNAEETFDCNMCAYKTNKKKLLSRHIKNHSDERPHKCDVCEKDFKTWGALSYHKNIHLGRKPYACKDCDKAFSTHGELSCHIQYRHTEIKPHKCTECEYRCVEMSKLRRHMRCHTGERPYKCPHCRYASPDTFKLKRHLRTHTGEKPYECDICHARFSQQNSLKSHRRIHVNEKPVFQCHLCPKTYWREFDLRCHIKKLHCPDNYVPPQKDRKCPHCGKIFAYHGYLIRHMETEKCGLKLGRMKQVQKDGSVIALPENNTLQELSDEPQVKNEALNEEEYHMNCTNDDNLNYVYEDSDIDDYEGEKQELEVDIKMEKIDQEFVVTERIPGYTGEYDSVEDEAQTPQETCS